MSHAFPKISFLILACLSLALNQAESQAASPISISSSWEPLQLHDDRLIDTLQGVSYRFYSPQKHPKGLTLDQPWEGNRSGNITVMQHGSRFLAYYRGQSSAMDKPGPSVVCYLESDDGVHWIRPSWNKHNGEIKRTSNNTRLTLPPNNNVVLAPTGNIERAADHFAPFVDNNPECSPKQKFKALSRITEIEVDGEIRTAYLGFHSSDGIDWSLISESPLFHEPASNESDVIVFWDPIHRLYREYHYFETTEHRSVKTSTSRDFIHWTEPETIKFDTALPPPGYLPRIFPNPHAPHIFQAWHPRSIDSNIQSIALATSRNATEFTTGLPSQPHATSSLAQGALKTSPSEISLFELTSYPNQAPELYRHAFRRDGLVALAPTDSAGTVLTHPLTFEGGELLLSFDAPASGNVRVELLDEAGTPLTNHRFETCSNGSGNQFEHTVRWDGSPDVKHLAGKPVRLKIHLKQATLYSFRFRDPKWRQGYPPSVQDQTFTSSVDGSNQPTLFYHPGGTNNVPMLVTLHTWSSDYYQGYHRSLTEWCISNNWAFVHPNFRGPNRNPAAGGSNLAVADVRDAVSWAKGVSQIDESQVYLVGTSGGGHMALLMAGRHPELWTGVSAWVGITDLAAWYHECKKSGRRYANELVQCCGGPPGLNATVDAEYRLRSPLTHLHRAAETKLLIDINAGITDGHSGSVPISHSLNAFNVLALPADRIPDSAIKQMTENAKVPGDLARQDLDDESYGNKKPLFRRTSNNARITIFDGGHELIPSAVIHWLKAQAQQ